jgi:AcrR family transcriptional regulator
MSSTRRQRQAAETERQLLDAARCIFEERGYKRTTVAAITERAKTAHGTFYLYFKNKDDVFGRVMTEATDVLYREAGAEWARDPIEGVRAATGGFLGVFCQNTKLWRCLLEAAFLNPEIELRWTSIRRMFIDRIAGSLRAQVRDGAIRPIDPELAASALGSMVEWFAYSHFVLGSSPSGSGVVDPAAVEAATDQLTDLWIHAVYGGRFDA